MFTATYRYHVDWNADGAFGNSGEGISEFVFEATWEYGRDFASQMSGRSKAGSCRITLENSDGRFSPFNAASPLYGQLAAGRRVRVTMQIGAGPEVRMWQGYLEPVSPVPGAAAGVSTTELLAYGVLASRSLQGRVSIPMHADIATGAAIQALRDLEETEAGFLRETKNGRLAFEDRAHRLSAPHTVSQATYGGGAPGDLFVWNPAQGDVSRGIANHIEAEVRTFDVSGETVLWALSGSPPDLAPGAKLTIKARFPTPTSPSGHIAVSEWTTVDYQANSRADGLGPDLTPQVDAAWAKQSAKAPRKGGFLTPHVRRSFNSGLPTRPSCRRRPDRSRPQSVPPCACAKR